MRKECGIDLVLAGFRFYGFVCKKGVRNINVVGVTSIFRRKA